jgi:hypothetical protein
MTPGSFMEHSAYGLYLSWAPFAVTRCFRRPCLCKDLYCDIRLHWPIYFESERREIVKRPYLFSNLDWAVPIGGSSLLFIFFLRGKEESTQKAHAQLGLRSVHL